MEKLLVPSGKSMTPEEAKFWRSVSQRALSPEVVMSLHLPNLVEVFSDVISKCVNLQSQFRIQLLLIYCTFPVVANSGL